MTAATPFVPCKASESRAATDTIAEIHFTDLQPCMFTQDYKPQESISMSERMDF